MQYIYGVFHLPKAVIRKLYRQPSPSDAKYGKPNKNGLVNISHKMLVGEMRGKHDSSGFIDTTRLLHNMIDLDNICSKFSTIRDGPSTVVSLMDLCSTMIITTGQASHFGRALSEIDPSLPEAYVEFDKLCWQLFHRPAILWSKQLRECKAKLLAALEAYSRKPMEQRPDMPHFLQNWEIECRKLGLSESDIAKLMLIQYFGYVQKL